MGFKLKLPGLDFGKLAMSMLDDGKMVKEISSLLTTSFDKFASRMNDGECLMAVPSTDKTKLHIYRCTIENHPDKSSTIKRVALFDLVEILARVDTSKLTTEQKKEIEISITDQAP